MLQGLMNGMQSQAESKEQEITGADMLKQLLQRVMSGMQSEQPGLQDGETNDANKLRHWLMLQGLMNGMQSQAQELKGADRFKLLQGLVEAMQPMAQEDENADIRILLEVLLGNDRGDRRAHV